MNEPFILQPSEGTHLKLADAELTFKAMSAQTGGVYSLAEGTWQPGGFGPLPHLHVGMEESFYILEGRFDFIIGERRLLVDPGTFLVAPRGVLHGFEAVGGPSRLMFMHTPPLEGFFFELQELTRNRRPDPADVRALMGRWGMEAPVDADPA